MKISHLTEEALQAADDAYLASIQPKHKPKAPPPPPPPTTKTKEKEKEKLSVEEEASREKWRQLVDKIRKGSLETLQTFWASLLSNPNGSILTRHPNGDQGTPDDPNSMAAVNTLIPEWLRQEEGKDCGTTLLQIAAAAGHEDVVRWLLVDLRADPTIGVPSAVQTYISNDATESDLEDAATLPQGVTSSTRKAYDLASTRAARNVFRRAAYAYPDWWNWLGKDEDGARVPSALTPEMEEADQRKKGVRRKGIKERQKEREEAAAAKAKAKADADAAEAEKKRLAASVPTRQKTGPQKLGGSSSTGSGTTVGNAGLGGMSAEMRAKIERERRARAAEARLKGPTDS